MELSVKVELLVLEGRAGGTLELYLLALSSLLAIVKGLRGNSWISQSTVK